ncbi:hypothetical protein [Halosimplex marinum]|uniref:hypothetical protein n=1 Tax=Halosimplex marinum TaxID=3396620 RepID=UPI003F57454D
MPEAVDPERLHDRATPAVVDVEGQGAVFVADVLFKDSGWIRITEWNGRYAYLPPHRVRQIKQIEVERPDDDLSQAFRVAEPEWRERAAEWTEDPEDPDDAERTVMA